MGSIANNEEEKVSARLEGEALAGLLKFIEDHRRRRCTDEDGFEAFEREVRKRFNEAEREFMGEALGKQDVMLPEIVIDGIRHRRVISGMGAYMTAAGPVSELRHRYRAVGTNGQSECPLELRAGLSKVFSRPWRHA